MWFSCTEMLWLGQSGHMRLNKVWMLLLIFDNISFDLNLSLWNMTSISAMLTLIATGKGICPLPSLIWAIKYHKEFFWKYCWYQNIPLYKLKKVYDRHMTVWKKGIPEHSSFSLIFIKVILNIRKSLLLTMIHGVNLILPNGDILFK